MLLQQGSRNLELVLSIMKMDWEDGNALQVISDVFGPARIKFITDAPPRKGKGAFGVGPGSFTSRRRARPRGRSWQNQNVIRSTGFPSQIDGGLNLNSGHGTLVCQRLERCYVTL